MTTFNDVLQRRLRADAGRPLVTCYDERTGERTELSVTTYANWVAKTASLWVEEFDLERGSRVRLDLPTHWLGPVFLGAAWCLGAVVVADGEESDLVVCGPDGVERAAALGVPVLASALLPMGVRFREALPSGVRDYGVEVWSQPDAFVPWDPPGDQDAAFDDLSQAALWTQPTAAVPERILTDANPVTRAGLWSFTGPFAAGGSTVWVAGGNPDRHADLAATEHAVVVGQPIRS
ncbi:TIGR03089 family protein [Nocardioides limicola]|uniref:TIGR03089 family protein n=1 Tax=Nocardioides limicola TaxID=2803368 RepID=UPI00193BF4F3|nr:TIGR03089 family protein [Nocardioides sp. DJM-14]